MTVYTIKSLSTGWFYGAFVAENELEAYKELLRDSEGEIVSATWDDIPSGLEFKILN